MLTLTEVVAQHSDLSDEDTLWLSGLIDQWDTIVLPEHRGHRLVMRVKAANLIALREAMPEARAIITWNAEENRPMLDVNEALGFRPILVEAAMEATAPLRRPASPQNRLQE